MNCFRRWKRFFPCDDRKSRTIGDHSSVSCADPAKRISHRENCYVGHFRPRSVLAAGMLLFTYILLRMQTIVSFLSDMLDYLPVDKTYLLPLLKMLGIAYIAEFSSSICKEAGYSAIAGQMELFAKLSIVALSIPELMYLMDVLEKYL